MLWTYALKVSVEQLNKIKVNYYGFTTMDKFAGPTTDINLKNHHTWVCPVYVLDAKLQRQNSWTIQAVILITCRDIYWSLTIPFIISSSGSKPSNLSFSTSISCAI